MYAIIFQNYVNNINGAVLDVIDYYLTILEHNPNIKLLILNYNLKFKSIIETLIENRFDVQDLDYKKNIQNINKIDLLKIQFERLLIADYGTIQKIRGLIQLKNNKSKIFILSDLHTDKPEFTIDKSLYPDGCVQYYGEMPFVYKDVQYNHKILFDRMKKLRKVKNAIFLHSPLNDNFDFMKNYKLFDNRKVVFKTHNHKENLFELFDTFVYYHANKWFDPRPRLLLECTYYKKKCFYFNPNIIKDGSYYRHIDLNLNGLKNRFLTKDDEIIREFI